MDETEGTLARLSERLGRFAEGTTYGRFNGRRYRVHVSRPIEQVVKLYAEELGGNDIISFNLYALRDSGDALKPCEMSSSKVFQFVLGFESDPVEPMGPPVTPARTYSRTTSSCSNADMKRSASRRKSL